MSKHSLVTVLAEDARHQRLVRRYLYRLGYQSHEIRDLPLPSGRGCGEQWVRERYATEVKAFRSRSARAKTALIVAIDADKGDVDRRVRQLRESLELPGLSARGEDEEIVHLIPRRSVETWILCLSGETVDEFEDYSQQNVDPLIPRSAQTLFEWTRANATPRSEFVLVPSLNAAISEARRRE